ncbi:MAG TPA: hypothetical protein VMA83_11285 [Solirubrobacteraceae bacterium]|nr:hypothetical protein [Solirubrobacteraceae bacterium]
MTGQAEQRGRRPSAAERDAAARDALTPLAPGERPRPLLVACAVSAALALAVVVGALTDRHLSAKGGSLPGAIVIAGVFLLLARGMYQRRYGAVLGFEALIAFQLIVASLALALAATLLAAAVCVALIGLGGWLFWKLVRVMGRIQATDAAAREPTPDRLSDHER